MFTSAISYQDNLQSIQTLLRDNLNSIPSSKIYCIYFNFDDNCVSVYFWGLYGSIEAMSIKIYQEIYIDGVRSINIYDSLADLLN